MRPQSVHERKIFVKTPGGITKVVYKRSKPNLARCSDTGEKLKGIPRIKSFKLKSIVKSKKRVNRKYGGQLSSNASRRRIIELTRRWLK